MSLRERLLARQLPTEPYEVRVEPSPETQAAEEELARATRALRGLEVQSAPPEDQLRKAKSAVTRAQKARDACYEQVILTALPPEDFEALQDKYPEADSEEKLEKREADTAFTWHLFLACAPEELSEDDWRSVVYQTMSQGERLELFNTCIALNVRGRTLGRAVPKG